MSHITDVILTVNLTEEINDEGSIPIIDDINTWLTGYGQGNLVRVDALAKGPKVMQAAVFLAVFNGFEYTAFLGKVINSSWESPKDVQVFLKDEEIDN